MTSKTAFLILSCDRYSGLWEKHFECLDHYWPDCPYPKYLLTNYKDSNRPDIKTIQVGEDQSWSANLKKALEVLRSEHDHVLLTFDDLFLVANVNNRDLLNVIESFHSLNGQFLQLIKWHKKPKIINDLLGLIDPGSLYRPNCVYALWNIETLSNLLVDTESAWQFERNGAHRSDQYDGFYVVHEDIFKYRNTVIRGKIVPKDVITFNLQNIPNLKVMTTMDLIRFRSRYWAFRLFLFFVPRKLQVPLAKAKSLLK